MSHTGPVCSLVGVLCPLSDRREPVAAKLLKSQVISPLNFNGSRQKNPHYLDDLTLVITEDKRRSIAGPCVRWSLREEWGLLQNLWEISGVTVPGGAVGEVVRLHAHIMGPLAMPYTGIHPFSYSLFTLHCILTSGPWSLLEAMAEKRLLHSFLEHSEENTMVFPFFDCRGLHLEI